VIETVTVLSSVPSGARSLGWLTMNSKVFGKPGSLAALSFTEQGPYNGGTLYTAVAPITLRLNASDYTLQAYVYRTGASGEAWFSVNVAGYIEEL
jgi:hypothetical protein